MRWLTWFETLNLIDGFNYYLILAFLLSTGIRIRTYQSIVGLVIACPSRWPKLLKLVKKHRTIFLGWPMLLAVGLAFALMVGNSLAIHLVWTPARVTFEELWGTWLPLVAVILSGGLMLLLDCRAIFSAGHFDRIALEGDLDKAESWLKSWMSPALRMVTFGFVNPRKIVGAEVQRVLVDANWIVIGGMRRMSLRIGMQLAFGLSLWLTWAVALRGPQVVRHAAHDNSRAAEQGGFQQENGLIVQGLLPPVSSLTQNPGGETGYHLSACVTDSVGPTHAESFPGT
jgi:hypothetical protein